MSYEKNDDEHIVPKYTLYSGDLHYTYGYSYIYQMAQPRAQNDKEDHWRYDTELVPNDTEEGNRREDDEKTTRKNNRTVEQTNKLVEHKVVL